MKISIIVPIYNREQTIVRLIECVLSQTYDNYELLLIDDGSTDNTYNICKKYQNDKIKVFHKKNTGVSDTRNYGLKKASGKLITFIDSDDIVSSNFLQVMYDYLIKYNADIVACNHQSFDKNITFDEEAKDIKIFSKIEAHKDMINDGVITNFLWNKLFRKELFAGLKFKKGIIYEDVDILHKIVDKCEKIVYIDQVLYGYYFHTSSLVNSFNLEKNKNFFEVIEGRIKFLKKYNIDTDNYLLMSIYGAMLQSAKSHRLDIIQNKDMKKYIKYYRKKFKKLNKKVKFKRKILFYTLYLNKYLLVS